MSKEKKASTEATTPVEMTDQQRKEYLDFLAQKDAEQAAKAEADEYKGKTTKVNLQWQHNVNGRKMGPGRNIEVPLELVGLLQQQEDQKRNAEVKMLTANKRVFEVLQSGGAIEVVGQRKDSLLK